MINENKMIDKYFLEINWKEMLDDAKSLSERPLTPMFKRVDNLLEEAMYAYGSDDKRKLKKHLIELKKTIRDIESSL